MFGKTDISATKRNFTVVPLKKCFYINFLNDCLQEFKMMAAVVLESLKEMHLGKVSFDTFAV